MLLDALDTILSKNELAGVDNSIYQGLVKNDYTDLK